MNTEEIMENETVMETATEQIVPKVLENPKVFFGAGLTVGIVCAVAYKYAIKPLLKKIKEKKEPEESDVEECHDGF